MYAEPGVDWQQLLLPKPHAMYGMKIKTVSPRKKGLSGPAEQNTLGERSSSLAEPGEQVEIEGILDNDIIIIDCSRMPEADHPIVAALDGEFALGHLTTLQGQRVFLTGNESVIIRDDSDFRIVGVVSRLVRFYGNQGGGEHDWTG